MSDANSFGFDPVPVTPPARSLPDISSMGLLPPLPKPTTPVEPRPLPVEPKPAPAAMPKLDVPLLKVEPESVPIEPAKPPLPGRMAWVPEAMRALVRPSKQKGIIAAGVASLAAGVAVANLMWPSPAPHAEPVAKVEKPEPEKPKTPALPSPKLEVSSDRPEPVVLPAPGVPLDLPPLPKPTPVDVGVKRASVDLPLPPLPTAPATPPVIDAPAMPAIKLDLPSPTLPDKPVTPPAPTLPEMPKPAAPVLPEMPKPVAGPTLPELPVKPPAPTLPTMPEVKVAPAPTLPEMPAVRPAMPEVKVALPTLPEMPKPTPPTMPEVKVTPPAPTLPELPKPATPPTMPEVKVAPPTIVDVKPIPPATPAPDSFVPSGRATAPPQDLPKLDLPRPVTPASAMAPREDYDVDVHYFKAGESWQSISKQHFGDERYGNALKAYNPNPVVTPNQPIDVPPIHVLRRKFPDLIVAPGVVEPLPAKPVSTTRVYEIPSGGLTFKEIARRALGDENYWGQIWELNSKLRADEPVPAGTKIKLPAEAKIGD